MMRSYIRLSMTGPSVSMSVTRTNYNFNNYIDNKLTNLCMAQIERRRHFMKYNKIQIQTHIETDPLNGTN